VDEVSTLRRVAGIGLVAVAAFGCRHDPDAVREEHIKQGDVYFRDGHFPQATVEYQKAVTADPKSSDARQRLAESYVRIGMADFATKEYVNAARLAPARTDLQMQAAALLLAARRFEEAEPLARQAVASGPKIAAAHMLLGNSLVGLSSVSEGTAQVSLDPASPGSSARFTEAEAEYRTAVVVEADAVLPHVALGRLQEALQRPAEAEASYKRALAISAENVSALRALAHLYLLNGRTAEAEVQLKSLARAMGSPAGHLELADYYIALGRWPDARSVLEPLLNRITTFQPARIRMAALEFQDGRRERAHQLTDEVLEQLPNDPKALLLKARLLRADGRMADAMIRARSAMDADPQSIVARRELASLYALLHNRDEAIRVLRIAAGSASDAESQVDLARLYLAHLDAERARTAAERAVSLAGASQAARALLVRALVSSGDFSRAEAAFKAIPKEASQSVDVMIARADLKVARHASEPARVEYQRVLAAEPDNTEALAAVVKLEIGARRFAAAQARLRAPAVSHSSYVMSVSRRLDASVSAAEGDLKGAERTLTQLLAENAADADSWLSLAELRKNQGRLAEAQTAAEQAVRHQPAWPHATLVLGAILEAQAKTSEARTRYDQLLKIDPDAADVRRKLGR
jgi:tetratricopeptide (TPR) repeat protein